MAEPPQRASGHACTHGLRAKQRRRSVPARARDQSQQSKIALAYYLSLLVASAAPDAPLWLRMAGGAGMAAISLGWYLLLAWTFSRAPMQRLYRRVQPAIAGGTGLLMVGFGLALIFAL